MLDFRQLQTLVANLTRPDGPQFYRMHYGMRAGVPARRIDSIEEWQSLRPVTKDDLIAAPLASRLFKSLPAVDYLLASSGTTGKPPLFSPQIFLENMEYRLRYHDFQNAILTFTIPQPPHWHEEFLAASGRLPRVVVFDPKRPEASIRLAKAAGVDALSLFVYQVQIAGELMKQEAMNENIRLVEITGEVCSQSLYNYLQQTFPCAVILQQYGMSEIEDGHIGLPCKPLDGSNPLAVYHFEPRTRYAELIHPESEEIILPTAGAEGELVITTCTDPLSVFPLIRFRVGDMVRVVEEKCPHGSWSFTVLGRAKMDFVKITGGVLRADEIRRVLRLFPERTTDSFELHCYAEETEKGPLLRPVLKLRMNGTPDLVTLAHDIARNLRTGPSFTYADGVIGGRYLPLECAVLEHADSGKKHQWIVRHDR